MYFHLITINLTLIIINMKTTLLQLAGIFLLFISISTNAQEVQIIDGLSSPLGLWANDTNLYICEHGLTPNSGYISRIDFSDENPVSETLAGSFSYPRAICIIGDELFYARNHIYKFNINDSNPTPELVVNAGIPRAIIPYGNTLYISGDDRISKIDITQPNPTLNTVVDGIENRILAFAIKDDYLYFGHSNKVSKISLTEENPTAELVIDSINNSTSTNVYSLAFKDDILLIGLALTYQILKADLSEESPLPTDFINTISGRPSYILVQDDALYIAGNSGNNIFKIENLNQLLSIDNVSSNLKVKIYPNPATNYISFDGINETTNYQLTTLTGKSLKKGVISENDKIDISELSVGIYLLKLSNNSKEKQVFKILKG